MSAFSKDRPSPTYRLHSPSDMIPSGYLNTVTPCTSRSVRIMLRKSRSCLFPQASLATNSFFVGILSVYKTTCRYKLTRMDATRVLFSHTAAEVGNTTADKPIHSYTRNDSEAWRSQLERLRTCSQRRQDLHHGVLWGWDGVWFHEHKIVPPHVHCHVCIACRRATQLSFPVTDHLRHLREQYRHRTVADRTCRWGQIRVKIMSLRKILLYILIVKWPVLHRPTYIMGPQVSDLSICRHDRKPYEWGNF